jgi:DNA-directed RNA polymerase specialized sigma24 family protein
MAGRPWSADDDALLRRLFAAGALVPESAAALGRTGRSVAVRRHRLGLVRRHRATPGQEAAVAAILRRHPGRTNAEVGAEVGLDPGAVRRIRRAAGVAALSTSQAASRRESLARKGGPSEALAKYLAALDGGGPMTVAGVARALRVGRKTAHASLVKLRAKGLAFAEGKAGRPGRAGHVWHSFGRWLADNPGLAYSVARRVAAIPGNRGVDVEDVAGVARLGFARAVASFRPGVRFVTYAYRGAWGEAVKYCLEEQRRGVYVPRNLLTQEGVAPSVGSLEAIAAANRGTPNETWEPAARAGGGAPPVDPLFWEKAVRGLPAKHAAVLVAFYRDGMTQAEVGRTVLGGLSKGRAEQVLREAEAAVRRLGNLEDFEEFAA